MINSKAFQNLDPKPPGIIYGTAWKEERTEDLTLAALRKGFRWIDTANQRKHYFEAAVGKSIQTFLKHSELNREDLFIQTKYTFSSSQDHRKPYDDSDSITNQVLKSFESSLVHFNTDYLDSYLLHGPQFRSELGELDWEAWRAIESLKITGRTLKIGVSNFSPSQLDELCSKAEFSPEFVQNRCFASMGWDEEVRQVAERHGVIYQGFSLLTAKKSELSSDLFRELAQKYQKTIPQITFRFSQQIGILPLTGTSDEKHMSEDLDLSDFKLTSDEIERILSL